MRKQKLGLIILILSFIAGISLTWQFLGKLHPVHNLTIATFSKTGEYYAFGQAFSEIINKHHPNIAIKVLATNGSVENQQLLINKKVDLALIQSDTPFHQDTRTIALLFPELFHLMARRESNINQVQDLKGKRIALMPKGSGSYRVFWPLITHYGLKENDFDVINLPSNQAIEALDQGNVDAVFMVSALGNQSLIKLLQNPQIKLVPIDQGNALQLHIPALETSTIPKGTYNGGQPIPQEDLPGVAVRALLVTHRDLNSSLVYEITRALFETRNDLATKYSKAVMIPVGESLSRSSFIFHPGSKMYYDQDKPSFLVQYAEPMGLFLSLIMLLLSGIWQLKTRLQGKQKNRADMYNLEILKLIDQINSLHDLEKLKQVHHELFYIFSQVLVDLDKDLITQESFQSFSFTWEVAIGSIRHRELLLRNIKMPTTLHEINH